MRFLRKTLSALLVMCMVFSMVLPAAAAEDVLAPEGNRIVLDKDEFAGVASVWVDGVEYPVTEGNAACYVSLPEDAEPGSLASSWKNLCIAKAVSLLTLNAALNRFVLGRK